MTEPVIVLDAGAVDQVITNQEFRVVLEDLLRSGWSPIIPTPVDAIVAAQAADAGLGVVFTTDPGDLRRLLADRPMVRVERP